MAISLTSNEMKHSHAAIFQTPFHELTSSQKHTRQTYLDLQRYMERKTVHGPSARKGILAFEGGNEEGIQYFSTDVSSDDRGASLYEDIPDFKQYPFAYPEHPDFKNWWGRGGSRSSPVFKEPPKGSRSSVFEPFEPLEDPLVSAVAPTLEAKDFVSFIPSSDVTADSSISAINQLRSANKDLQPLVGSLKGPVSKSFQNKVFESILQRFRRGAIRSLQSANSPEALLTQDIRQGPFVSAIDQLRSGTFQPPSVEAPQGFIPEESEKSKIQNILEAEVVEPKDVIDELKKEALPEGFFQFDIDGGTESDPFDTSVEGYADFADQAEAAARGQAPIPGTEPNPFQGAQDFTADVGKAMVSKGFPATPEDFALTVAQAIGKESLAAIISPTGAPILGIAPPGLVAAGIFGIGTSAYNAYSHPYSGFGFFDVLQGAFYDALPFGKTSGSFFDSMANQQEAFDLLAEDAFSLSLSNRDMDTLLGREGFFGQAEGEHGLTIGTPQGEIASNLRSEEFDDQELNVDTNPHSPLAPSSIDTRTFSKQPFDTVFDPFGTAPTSGPFSPTSPFGTEEPAFTAPPGTEEEGLPGFGKESGMFEGEGFFSGVKSFIEDFTSWWTSEDDPSPPTAGTTALAGVFGLDDDDEGSFDHGTSGVPGFTAPAENTYDFGDYFVEGAPDGTGGYEGAHDQTEGGDVW